ncbi:MAG: serine protease [Hungatella sp.]|nr:serine protease [Hungatella sp.]
MPDLNSPEKEPRERRPFIREKIARPPMTRKQLAGRFLAWLFIAVLGGGAAGAAFAVVNPLAERYLATEPSEESVPVTIPKDDPPETSVVETQPQEPTSSQEESTEETSSGEVSEGESETKTGSEPSEESESESETEALEDVIQSVMETYEYSADDLDALYGILRSVAQEADRGIVEVHSVKQEMDWFDNPVETAGLFSGVVIASTEQELLILTPDEAVEHADSIKVTFGNGAQADGSIKQTDTISGMAIVSVPTSQMDEEALLTVAVLKLGNSYSVKRGDLVAALGAPAGVVHSSAYGSISYVVKNVQIADGITRLLYADIRSDARAGTFLVNLSGEVIGWVTDAYEEENKSGIAVAMAVSDYKSVLEKMSNGQPIPYLGIYGQEVSAAKVSEGVPPGIYVTECVLEGPAYTAGIQSGDIIVSIGGRDISTMKDYQNQLETLTKDAAVTIVVQRRGIDEYKELEYQVTAGAR